MDCPYGTTRRVVTAGEGGIANVHVITVTQGNAHSHDGYDEVYFVLRGNGWIEIEGVRYEMRAGSVVVIPAGCVHSLASNDGQPLEFVIFGTPPMSADDPRFTPHGGKA
mgnify:CR=1 FL=1